MKDKRSNNGIMGTVKKVRQKFKANENMRTTCDMLVNSICCVDQLTNGKRCDLHYCVMDSNGSC